MQSPWIDDRARRGVQRAAKRQAVLHAAAVAFAQRGYDKTSMDDIAAALGITKPTLYNYFEDKADLLHACNSEAIARFDRAAAEANAHRGSSLDKLELYLTRSVQYATDELGRALARIDERDLGAKARNERRQLRTRVEKIFRTVISRGIERGEIRRDLDPKLVTFALFGAFNNIAIWYKETGESSLEQIVQQYFAMIFDGLRPRR